MSNVVYLITGANRPDGIGFAAITTLLENPKAYIVAAARDPSSAVELQQLSKSSGGRLVVVKMEIANLESVKTSFNEIAGLPFVKDHGLDVLFINAGVLINPMVTASLMDPTDALNSFQVNTWGAIYVAQAFLPLLRLGTQKKIVYTTSGLGSTTLALGLGIDGGWAAYSMSKAASNHYFKRLSEELKAEDFTVVCYHPGVVGTSMSPVKEGAMVGDGIPVISPAEGGRLAANFINAWGPKENGKFLSEQGAEFPW